ncbi:hypothetical protein RsoM2USA_12 [Ralstonia phage RsoM2USA]|nr:hypothetical protein RsoM2USA_12 [Ralstonia phage RsoM2USA]
MNFEKIISSLRFPSLVRRDRQMWNIEEFGLRPHVGVPIGKLVNTQRFSDWKGIRVLDLPLHMPQQGWKIPVEILDNFGELLTMIHARESQYGFYEEDHYVYITVDQKTVKANATHRRAGAHSDAFISDKDGKQVDITGKKTKELVRETGPVSHTYICYDKLPTEFFNAVFPLEDGDCETSLKVFDRIAEGLDEDQIITYDPYSVIQMTPYDVHRCALAHEDMDRTFVKVSVSRKRYVREGNTINPGFIYDRNWSSKPRSKKTRNHPW